MTNTTSRTLWTACGLVLLLANRSYSATPATVTFGASSIDHLVLAGTQIEGPVQYRAITGAGWEVVNTSDPRGNPPSALATFFNDESPNLGDRVEFQLVAGGLFTFTSVDTRANSFPATADHVSISGSLGGVPVGSISPPPTASFITTSGFSGLIDTLTITVTALGDNAYWVDNISLSIVPEPSTCALAPCALSAFALAAKRCRPRRQRV